MSSWSNLSTVLTNVLARANLKQADTDSVMSAWNSEKTRVSRFLAQRTAAKPKDANAPKKALSGYIIFCSEKRPEVRGVFANPTEVTTELGRRWNALSASEKQKYHDLAKKDKQRYEAEMANYTPPVVEATEVVATATEPAKRKKKPKTDSDVKRPLTSYLIFSQEQRPRVKEQNPTLTNAELVKKLSEMWNALAPTEKDRYRQKQEVDRLRYQKEKAAAEETRAVKVPTPEVAAPAPAPAPTKTTESKSSKTKKPTETKETKKVVSKEKKTKNSFKETPGFQMFREEHFDVTKHRNARWDDAQVELDVRRQWEQLPQADRKSYEMEATEADEVELEDA